MNNLSLMSSGPSWPSRVARTLWVSHIEMWRHFARRWHAYAALGLAGLGAAHYVGINITTSVPERLVWLEHGAVPMRGDLVVFHFTATGAATSFKGMRGLKRVQGMPGDSVTVLGRMVYVNGEPVGTAIERTPRGSVLHTIPAGTIPLGQYFVSGGSPDSLDSRYSEIGLVRSEQIVARAHTIF